MIRPAEMPDIESLAIVHAAAWEAAYRGLFPDRVIDEITIEKRSRNWERSIADPDRENLLYEGNGEVLGFLSYLTRPHRASRGSSIFPFALSILPFL